MSDQRSPSAPYPSRLDYPVSPPRTLSVSSMVVGIVSFFFGLTLVVPIVGLVLGFMGLKREPAGRTFALAGVWINGVMLVLGAITLVLIVLVIGAGFLAIPWMASTSVG